MHSCDFLNVNIMFGLVKHNLKITLSNTVCKCEQNKAFFYLYLCFNADFVKAQPSTAQNSTVCGRDNGHAVKISSCLLWQ